MGQHFLAVFTTSSLFFDRGGAPALRVDVTITTAADEGILGRGFAITVGNFCRMHHQLSVRPVWTGTHRVRVRAARNVPRGWPHGLILELLHEWSLRLREGTVKDRPRVGSTGRVGPSLPLATKCGGPFFFFLSSFLSFFFVVILGFFPLSLFGRAKVGHKRRAPVGRSQPLHQRHMTRSRNSRRGSRSPRGCRCSYCNFSGTENWRRLRSVRRGMLAKATQADRINDAWIQAKDLSRMCKSSWMWD